MKSTWKWSLAGLFLVALAAIGLHGDAGAQMQVGEPNPFRGILQGQPVVGINRSDSTARLISVDALGNLYMTESAPSASNYSYQPSVISAIMADIPDGVVVAGLRTNRDSTSVIDCRGYNRAALLLFPSATATTDAGNGSADSLFGQVLALEVRAYSGATADSQSTFRVMPQRIGSGNFGGVSDTVGSLSDIIKYSEHIAGYAPLRGSLLPSEKAIVVANTARNSANGFFGDPRGMVIWSSRLNEANSATPPFLGFRLRCLHSYTMASGNATVRDSSTALPMRVRCDLVLWRE